MDLHHMSYDGVSQDRGGRWVSREKDTDLMPLCRDCHERVHRILDDHKRDYKGWNRHRATIVIVARLRREHERRNAKE